MSPKEVTGALGPARRASISGSRECSLYGSPTLEVETFTLYEVCYDAQKLVGVTERRFTASPVEPSAAPEAK